MQMKAQILAVLGTLLISCGAFAQDREQAMVMSLGDTSSGKWSTSFFSISSVDNMTFGRTEPKDQRSFGGYNYLSLNYKLDQDRKVSFRLPFTYQTEGVDPYGEYVSARGDLQDVFVAMSFYDLGYLGPIDLSGAIKVYAPTSQMSKDSGLITRIRGELFVDYNFTRFSSITWVIKPGMFVQQNSAYFNETTAIGDDGLYVKSPISATKQFELEHYLELVADINQYFALKPRAGFDETWYYGSVSNDIDSSHMTKFVAGLGLEVRPMRGWNFTVGFQNETTLNSFKGKDVAYWQPENTSFTLLTNVFLFNL